MPNPLLEKFQRRMLELGCTRQRTRRAAIELAEHYEDLVQAAVADGTPQPQAEQQAASQLGEASILAERAAEAARHGTWCGRHPVIACGILAPLAFIPALAVVFLLVVVGYGIGYAIKGPALDPWISSTLPKVLASKPAVAWIQGSVNAALMGLFAVFVCYQIRRSALHFRWAVLACAMCALHGWFFRVTVAQHFIGLGYWWKPNLSCVLPPLAVAAAFAFRARWLQNRFVPVTSLLLGCCLFSFGCASHEPKPVLQRGWIGGEYRTARKNNFANVLLHAQGEELSLPAELAKQRHSAVLLKQLHTNSPVALAGLQQNDYILAVDSHPVGNLRQFYKLVDHAKPGQELRLTAYRQGETFERPVQVGTETYKKGGVFLIAFPSVVHGWDLCFQPGLSLVFVGCEPNSTLRHELGKEKETYQEDWKAFAAIFELSSGKRITSQESARP